MEQSTLKAVMSELGKRSWEARKKKHGIKAVKQALSSAGQKGQKAMRKTLKERAKVK